ncbi:ribonuclease 3-like [Malus sylvestris]|uniref:ribonuclease 3-like n=1 Tax=Malus sylvestris TaxID=3752 RepID=UPI0010A9C3D6|nr:ribonuclease 3-like [Malus domestica]XP_050131486.1 ribonuclease 3-like [Malus sylvestris]
MVRVYHEKRSIDNEHVLTDNEHVLTEWEKHGTCSESELDQKNYFEAALKLRVLGTAQVYLCVDTSGQDIIECPLLPRGRCASKVQFPKF